MGTTYYCELLGFLAIIINMGVITVPTLEDYWKTSWLSHIPVFSRVMPRDRFELIFWMLHCSHSVTTPAKWIDKVRTFLDMLLRRFQQKYTPGQNLAIDESMLRFRGRLKIYIVYRDLITTLIISILHFTIIPIFTFNGAFISEIQ